MKIALVYDRVNKWGGAERVLLALHQIWPQAPLYTAVYHPSAASWAKDFQIIPSFLNKFPLASSHHEIYPWLMPFAFESFNFDEFDVVISITSEFAKGIITKPETLHLCYCLTPTRYLWSGCKDYPIKFWMKPILARLRLWDQLASQRPDLYLAISKTVKKRIKKYYQRESEVIYPGIEIEKFSDSNYSSVDGSGYFLIVSRLVSYKHIEIAVEAFNQLGWPLKIIGRGRQENDLKKRARSNIEFLGGLTDKELIGYYQNCRAVIMPQEEDFGLVALEAQAAGKPVIAFARGGAAETVINGKTGLFFKEQTAESLIKALKKFKRLNFNPDTCRRQAEQFDVKIFQKKFKNYVEKTYASFC